MRARFQFRIRWPRSWFVDSNSGCALSTTDIFGAVPWEPIHFYVRLRRLPDQRHQRQPSYFSSSQFVDVFAAGGPLLSSALELQPSQPPVAVPLRRKHSRTVSGLPESFSAAGLQSPSAAINLGASAAGRRKLPAMGFMVVVGDEGFERKLFLRGDTNETEIVATSPLAARSMVAVDFTFDLRGALQRLMDEKQTEQRHGSDSPNAVINARSVSLLVIPYCLVPGQTGSFVLSVRTSQPDIFLSASAAKHDDDDVCVRSLATQYGSWAASANGGIDNCGGSMSEAPLTFLQNPQIIVRCVHVPLV